MSEKGAGYCAMLRGKLCDMTALASELAIHLRELRVTEWGTEHVAAGPKGSRDWILMERTDELIGRARIAGVLPVDSSAVGGRK